MEIRLVRYPAGVINPLHTHPCGHGMYVLEGQLVTHKGTFGPGYFVWFPEGETMSTAPAPKATPRCCSLPIKASASITSRAETAGGPSIAARSSPILACRCNNPFKNTLQTTRSNTAAVAVFRAACINTASVSGARPMVLLAPKPPQIRPRTKTATVVRCYSLFDHFFPPCGLLDYTEGIYHGDSTTPYEVAQKKSDQLRPERGRLHRRNAPAGNRLRQWQPARSGARAASQRNRHHDLARASSALPKSRLRRSATELSRSRR